MKAGPAAALARRLSALPRLVTATRTGRAKQRRRGRPRKYGPRMTPERIEALPVHRSARILYGGLEVVRYRSCRVAARFLEGRVVRAVWVRLGGGDPAGGGGPAGC